MSRFWLKPITSLIFGVALGLWVGGFISLIHFVAPAVLGFVVALWGMWRLVEERDAYRAGKGRG